MMLCWYQLATLQAVICLANTQIHTRPTAIVVPTGKTSNASRDDKDGEIPSITTIIAKPDKLNCDSYLEFDTYDWERGRLTYVTETTLEVPTDEVSEKAQCWFWYYMQISGNNRDALRASEAIDKQSSDLQWLASLVSLLTINLTDPVKDLYRVSEQYQYISGNGTSDNERLETRGWFMNALMRIKNLKITYNRNNAIQKKALGAAIVIVQATCWKLETIGQRLICWDLKDGHSCVSWSGGGNAIEYQTMYELMKYFYDNYDH